MEKQLLRSPANARINQFGRSRSPCQQQVRTWNRSHILQIAKASFDEKALDASNEALEQAWELLKTFTKKEARGLGPEMLSSKEKRSELRDALLLVSSHPWASAGYSLDTGILLGVLASDIRLGVRSLRDYCAALGVEFITPTSRIPNAPALPSIATPVYIKYNSATKLCYVTAYDGRDRGVLVNLGTEQIGHLPLGLHDEEMEQNFELSK